MNTDNKKTDKNKVRAAIVGAGLMGLWHAHSIEKVGGEVVAVFDIDKSRADSLASKYSKAQSFDNIEVLLKKLSPDVLHVCTPTETHQNIAELAIKAGVNLLIEKPIVQTAIATAALFELALQHKVNLCPVHQFIFQDGIINAQKQLNDIGKINHFQATICSAGGEGLGSAQLDTIAADILPHPLSLLKSFLGENLTADNWNMLRISNGEFRVFGTAKEASISIFVSMNSRPTLNSFQIFGSNGTIHIDLFHGYSIIESGKTSKAKKILHPFDFSTRHFASAAVNLGRRSLKGESAYPGLRRLIDKFYDSIKNGARLPIKPVEAIAVAQIRDILLLMLSKREFQPVDVH